MDTNVGRSSLPSQPLDDSLLDFLINILPLPINNPALRISQIIYPAIPALKISLLLRQLESQVANQSISETLLDLLQQIVELDLQAGYESLDSIRAAYLAVAVVCTMKFLRNSLNSGDSRTLEYFHAVKRIWRQRVCKLETTMATKLISDELWNWKNDIETAVWDDSACSPVLEKSQGIEIEPLSLYVKEKKVKMRPFLESIADAFRGVEKFSLLCGNLCQDWDKGMDLQPSHGNDENDKREMHKNYDLPPTPEVNRVLKALQSSSLELQAAVVDPLPDALRIADIVGFSFSRKNISNESMEECHRRSDSGVVHITQNNDTAGTCEDSSIGGRGSRVRLPSPKGRFVVSPLKPYLSHKLTKRRPIKKWSPLEEKTLRAGVEKHGTGNWACILRRNKDVFVGRTAVDLKDKWRNMSKSKMSNDLLLT